ncbi:hypothetical protein M422DRAFT_25219 [Sphaerobolus stellatus SS14]|nr:hypothetical protein M422DRAFT_25219 [Sphaerobolus stellatus SS14]
MNPPRPVTDTLVIHRQASSPTWNSDIFQVTERRYNQGLSAYLGPGRLLGHVYRGMGKRMEEAAGRVAHRLGFGPLAVTQRIDEVFSGGPDKTQKVLETLYNLQAQGQTSATQSWYKSLRKDCSALMKYTFPSKSPEAQTDAFRNIVRLCTWYPQVRPLLRASESKHVSSNEILKTWMRKDGEVDEQWEFYSLLAAFCISNNDTSELVEGCKPAELGKVSYQGSCLVERLIQISDDPTVPATCRMIAVRYIAGILHLPRFWTEDITRHVTVKLLKMAIGFTQDVVDNISNMTEQAARSLTLDYEGIDMLDEMIIRGLRQTIALFHVIPHQVSYWPDLALQLFNLIERHSIKTILPRTYFTWEKLRDVLLRRNEDDSNEEDCESLSFLSEMSSPVNVDISREETPGVTEIRLQLSSTSLRTEAMSIDDTSPNDTDSENVEEAAQMSQDSIRQATYDMPGPSNSSQTPQRPATSMDHQPSASYSDSSRYPQPPPVMHPPLPQFYHRPRPDAAGPPVQLPPLQDPSQRRGGAVQLPPLAQLSDPFTLGVTLPPLNDGYATDNDGGRRVRLPGVSEIMRR